MKRKLDLTRGPGTRPATSDKPVTAKLMPHLSITEEGPMADIKIQRSHALGMDKARALAHDWMSDAAKQLGLTCNLVQGDVEDTISFERMGVTGQMKVRADAFELDTKLGMMMSAFKPLIEAEIDRNLANILAKAEGGTPKA